MSLNIKRMGKGTKGAADLFKRHIFVFISVMKIESNVIQHETWNRIMPSEFE